MIFLIALNKKNSRMFKAASLLKKNGAKYVFGFATHAFLKSERIKQLSESCLDELIVTNTLQIVK